MEHVDLQAGLRSLHASLGRMRDLLAWGQLKQQEARPGEPPSFQIYDPTADDMRNEYLFFLFTASRMHGILHEHRASIPAPVRATLQRKLTKVGQEVHQLNLHRRCPGY